MSAKIMGQVWDVDLSSTEQIVLLAMADHADHNGGNVYPSSGLIAWKVGCSEKTVRRSKLILEEKGLLILESAEPGKTKHYRIDLSKGVKKKPFKPHFDTPDILGGEPRTFWEGSELDTPDTAMSPHPGQNGHTPRTQLCPPNQRTVNKPSEKKDKFVVPSIGEVKAYCESLGLTATDGDAFFYAKEGNGWKNGPNPIVSWKATIQNWKAQGWMASQQVANHQSNGGRTLRGLDGKTYRCQERTEEHDEWGRPWQRDFDGAKLHKPPPNEDQI